MPAESRLRDAVEQGEGRIVELALLARAQELDDRGMMAGSRECAGFCDDRRRLGEALVAGLVFGHWDAIPRLPVNRPLHQLFCDRVFAEVRQRIRERLFVERLARADLCPRIAQVFAVPEAKQLGFDLAVGAVDDAIAIQVATGTAVPELELRGRAKLQPTRLERDADF